MKKHFIVFLACAFATLVECGAGENVSALGATTDEYINELNEDPEWVEYGTQLQTSRAHSTVLFLDSYIYIIGGCVEATCKEKVNAVDQIDPLKQKVLNHFSLPISIDATVPLTLAGSTAVVRALVTKNPNDPTIRFEGGNHLVNAPLVVGPCTYYHPDYKTNTSKEAIFEQYGTIWLLDNYLKRVVRTFSIPHLIGSTIPYRTNASCISSGFLIFIVGGVDFVNGKVLDTIDIYDTVENKYTADVLKLPQALRNPLVASDCAFLYVTGGLRRVVVPEKSFETDDEICSRPSCEECADECISLNSTALYSSNNTSGSSGCLAPRNVWCPSNVSMAFVLVGRLLEDDKNPFDRSLVSSSFTTFNQTSSHPSRMSEIRIMKIALPHNPELHHSVSQSALLFNYTASPAYLFSTKGKLCLMINTSFVNCFDVEKFLMDNITQGTTQSSHNWTQLLSSPASLSNLSPTLFAFVLPAGVFGSTLIFFAFGGFANSTDASEWTRIFYRISGYGFPAASGFDSIVNVNESLNITLFPPINGYARLSTSPYCETKAGGTSDVSVEIVGGSSSVAYFFPTQNESTVYVCFAYNRLWMMNIFTGLPMDLYLHTPITAFTPFSIDVTTDPTPVPVKPQVNEWFFGLIIATCIACISILTVVAMLIRCIREQRTRRGSGSLLDAEPLMAKGSGDVDGDGKMSIWHGNTLNGKAQPDQKSSAIIQVAPHLSLIQPVAMNPKSEKDCLVKSTTNSSRYEVIRRIGEGAFSAVYLVRRKDDGHLFALKYLNCADNKERLDAIRECETINSVQGHPSIIRLVDMFMNYEFDGLHQTPSSLTVPDTHTAAAVSPCWAVIGMKNQQTKQNPVKTPTPVDVPKLPRLFAESFASAQQEMGKFTITYRTPGQQPLLTEADVQLLTSLSPHMQNRRKSLWNENGDEDNNKGSPPVEGIQQHEEPLQPPPQCSEPHGAIRPKGLCDPPVENTPNTVGTRRTLFEKPRLTDDFKERTNESPQCESATGENRHKHNNSNDNKMTSAVTPEMKPNAVAEDMCAAHRVNPISVNNIAAVAQDPQRGHSEVKLPPQSPPLKCDEGPSPCLMEKFTPLSPGRQHIAALRFYGANAGAAAMRAGCISSKPVHTRYLCLVMEYHPMGDLCHYVLRHSARHNAELRRQVEAERAAQENTQRRQQQQQQQQQQQKTRVEKNPYACMEPCTVALDSAEGKTLSFFRPSLEHTHIGSAKDGNSEATSHMEEAIKKDNTPHHSNGHNSSCGDKKIHSDKDSNTRVNTSKVLDSCSAEENKEEDTKRVFTMRGNALTEPQLLSIAYQLAFVLRHLHSQRPPIVHRDLKPENILIRGYPFGEDENENEDKEGEGINKEKDDIRDGNDKDGTSHRARNKKKRKGEQENKLNKNETPLHRTRTLSSAQRSLKISEDVIPIVVTDFGLAFLQEGRWRAGRGGGTRPYIAPESWLGQTSTASDVWSLGCVLYALATARLTIQTVRIMYEEAKCEGFAEMVLNDILEENYSLSLAKFVVSLLVVNPAKRPSAEMVLQCFIVEDSTVQLDPKCPLLNNAISP